MSFAKLEAAATKFTNLINNDLDREVIKPMTLEAPKLPLDELHFFQLVVWCYGFFFEAATDALKECRALMKQSAPDRTNRYEQGRRIVNNLRTYKVHNLPPNNSNNKTRTFVEAWLAEFNADTSGVEKASESLCDLALIMLNDATDVWIAATSDIGDANQLFKRVKDALENNWALHELHQIAFEMAEEINLSGFDVKAFCTNHLEEWRQTAACFLDRASAAEGLRRTIRLTIHRVFGQVA